VANLPEMTQTMPISWENTTRVSSTPLKCLSTLMTWLMISVSKVHT
jgi:hypothetical protein